MYNKLGEKHNLKIIGPEIVEQLTFFISNNSSKYKNIQIDKYIHRLNELLSERIKRLNFNLIFFGDLLFIPFLEVNLPIIYLSDMTYEQMRIHYKKSDENQDKNSPTKVLDSKSLINFERLILEKASKIIYSSEWIKQKAVDFYNIDPNKIEIIEFGANIFAPEHYSIDINMDICKLVFIGRDWERKGGDKIMQIYNKLKEDKFPCTLTIIGSSPKQSLHDSGDDLVIIPSIDKSKQKQAEQLNKILAESHFLVLPTRFDAYGIVFCEASAYALPSITANVGGVGQPVKDSKNGFLLSAEAAAEDYAEKIKTVFSDKENYLKLRASSRHEYETRLNWDVWGDKINNVFEEVISEWELNHQ
ncbi:MAG: glycosyltransferase [Tissierellia bacterium]|nr:glycosyltransferase [Tissierellia bacterium]